LIHLVLINSIKNSLIIKRDIEIYNDILGPSKYVAKGKTTIKQSELVNIYRQLVELLELIKTYYSDVEVGADIMYVNNMPFLTSISKYMHYRAIRAVDNLECAILESDLENVVHYYVVRGFNMVLIVVNNQFRWLKDQNKVGMKINLVSKDEHAKLIKQFHRVLEEWACYYYTIVPFDTLSYRIVVELMTTVVFYINAFI